MRKAETCTDNPNRVPKVCWRIIKVMNRLYHRHGSFSTALWLTKNLEIPLHPLRFGDGHAFCLVLIENLSLEPPPFSPFTLSPWLSILPAMKVLTAIQAGNGSAGIPKLVTRIVKRIVGLFAPEQVILFGSYAKGTAGSDSDVDLLVVMPVSGSKRQKIVEIGVALHDFSIAKDIMISTPEDFSWRKDVVGTIEYPAAHEGIVLYAKS